MATITRKAPASYRVDLLNGWFELGFEELGECLALTERESNPDPIHPVLRYYIALNIEEADKRNYQRAEQLVELAE